MDYYKISNLLRLERERRFTKLLEALEKGDDDRAFKESEILRNLKEISPSYPNKEKPVWLWSLILLFASSVLATVLALWPVRNFQIQARIEADGIMAQFDQDYVWLGNQELGREPKIFKPIESITARAFLPRTKALAVKEINLESAEPMLRQFSIPKGSWLSIEIMNPHEGLLKVGGGGQSMIIDVRDSTHFSTNYLAPRKIGIDFRVYLEEPEEVHIKAGDRPSSVWRTRVSDISNWELFDLPLCGLSVSREIPSSVGAVNWTSSLKKAQIHIYPTDSELEVGKNEIIMLEELKGIITHIQFSDEGLFLILEGRVRSIHLGPESGGRRFRPNQLEVMTKSIPQSLLFTAVVGMWTAALGFRKRLIN